MVYSEEKKKKAINGWEDYNENIPKLKENIKTINDLSVMDEYPNGKKHTILILNRKLSMMERIQVMEDVHVIIER